MNPDMKVPSIRIGHGYDVHRFSGSGNHIMLAGVVIPHTSGVEAHSDGDVLLHALCDALLGAIAEGDIGQHFPDTDDKYKGIDSAQLLENVYQKVLSKGYELGNVDITIIAQAPVLSSFMLQMKQRLSELLNTPVSQINVKATTTEKLGFLGRGEGIAAEAVVLIHNN